MQLLLLLVVLSAKSIQVLLIFGNSREKLGIGLLTGQELGHHLLNIGVTSTGPDFLESLFKGLELVHLLLHLFLEERAP